MSMKLEHLTKGLPSMETKRPIKSPSRKRYVSFTTSIYTLYILQVINIVSLIILWLKVFFYMKGE